MSELYLYHATDKNNVKSILESGLLINPPKHAWNDMNCEGKIFLAFDADAAESYAECADDEPEEIVVFKVKLDALNYNSFGYDWNNRCEYYRDINSCVYKSDIPASCISICNPSNEPSQDIFSFKGTDLYEIILDTFDNEVETNLENQDD